MCVLKASLSNLVRPCLIVRSKRKAGNLAQWWSTSVVTSAELESQFGVLFPSKLENKFY